MTAIKRELLAIATLQSWGVCFLASPHSIHGEHLELTELMKCIVSSHSPRLKLGITAFFLVHPEKASTILQALPLLKKNQRRLLQYYYMAAVYLQRLWKKQLPSNADKILLPDYFSNELDLPTPLILHGRMGLFSLAQAMQQWKKIPYNYLSSFESLIQILKTTGSISHETTC